MVRIAKIEVEIIWALDYGKVEENLGTLQKHLTNAYNMMGNVFSAFANLGQKISSTQNLGSGTEKKKILKD